MATSTSHLNGNINGDRNDVEYRDWYPVNDIHMMIIMVLYYISDV